MEGQIYFIFGGLVRKIGGVGSNDFEYILIQYGCQANVLNSAFQTLNMYGQAD
jgi:hypothetical protein